MQARSPALQDEEVDMKSHKYFGAVIAMLMALGYPVLRAIKSGNGR